MFTVRKKSHLKERNLKDFIPGHGNRISSSAPLKTPAGKFQGRLFASALRTLVCQGTGEGGVCVGRGLWSGCYGLKPSFCLKLGAGQSKIKHKKLWWDSSAVIKLNWEWLDYNVASICVCERESNSIRHHFNYHFPMWALGLLTPYAASELVTSTKDNLWAPLCPVQPPFRISGVTHSERGRQLF